ncbi:hypothetical protein DYB32_001007 [Aphanomyces invadans]|uniref:Uncharacterized protein n=1 Tax=Aphanomyces invadans TaxID=157072 RepID=A0A418B848_9STRA|nr:hypothetical protein DYB32_001007 [Aphanomyces invadans]
MLARAVRGRFVKHLSTSAKQSHYQGKMLFCSLSSDVIHVAFVWGDGTAGQLGRGPVEKSGVARKYTELSPQPIDAFSSLKANVTRLSLGTTHSAAGLGDRTKQVDVPTWVEHLKDVHIVDVSCAVHHTAALDKEGRLFTWGYGGTSMSDSALGLGPSEGKNVALPTLVETFIDDVRNRGVRLQAVDCGDSHTVALSADGEIWTWGRGDNGRLGNGELISLDYPEPVEFFDSMTCTAIAAGRSFSLALRDDGRVYGWGKNNRTFGASHELGDNSRRSVDFQLGLEGGVLDINNAMERIPIEIRGFEGPRRRAFVSSAT